MSCNVLCLMYFGCSWLPICASLCVCVILIIKQIYLEVYFLSKIGPFLVCYSSEKWSVFGLFYERSWSVMKLRYILRSKFDIIYLLQMSNAKLIVVLVILCSFTSCLSQLIIVSPHHVQ